MARTKRKVNPILPVAVPEEKPKRVYQAGGYVRLSVEDSGKRIAIVTGIHGDERTRLSISRN